MELLYTKGYKIMLLHKMATDKRLQMDYEKYFDKGVKMPGLTTTSEADAILHTFIEKMSRVLKGNPTSKDANLFAVHASRSLDPIGFSGSSRIVSIIEISWNEDGETFRYNALYGNIPSGFIEAVDKSGFLPRGMGRL